VAKRVPPKISPKIIPSGSITVEIAAHIAACTFNEDFHAILQMYEDRNSLRLKYSLILGR